MYVLCQIKIMLCYNDNVGTLLSAWVTPLGLNGAIGVRLRIRFEVESYLLQHWGKLGSGLKSSHIYFNIEWNWDQVWSRVIFTSTLREIGIRFEVESYLYIIKESCDQVWSQNIFTSALRRVGIRFEVKTYLLQH